MAAVPDVNQHVPDFSLPGGVLVGDSFERRDYTLCERRGHPLVLAFYPGDDTSVCTKQLCSYSSGLDVFRGFGCEVWAISSQSVDSHETLARRHGLCVPLLADTERQVIKAFGIAAPGIGLRRSVFLLRPDGVLYWKHLALLGAAYKDVGTLTRRLSELTST
ncbi:peroxiredoxin [Streptomyces sp. H27-C3]|uniref:peroxiredoxin n=1 Tax=Streptomyces sp. H27-C3 TaxID=3046305 RepID=UPI0024BA4163|nr:peroxiredoxin [Streptomyces sp. H27-C3]MDJ0463840.1 peroxiredoxin [Streptomyces sp. H27-C3]